MTLEEIRYSLELVSPDTPADFYKPSTETPSGFDFRTTRARAKCASNGWVFEVAILGWPWVINLSGVTPRQSG
jgi:hypothetical protein